MFATYPVGLVCSGGIDVGKKHFDDLKNEGVSRRDFMKLCGLMAGMMGMQYLPPDAREVLGGNLASAYAPADLVAKALESKPRLPVIWLELQDVPAAVKHSPAANHPHWLILSSIR